MSPKKEGGAATPAKKRKSKLDPINAKVVKFGDYARGVNKLLVAAGASAPQETKDKIQAAAAYADQAVQVCTAMSEALLALTKAKWEPRIGGRDVLVAGSLAMVKPRHAGKYTDFFDKDDLASLVVLDVKGKQAKVQVDRDGLKGDSFVVPSYRLQARAA